MNKQLIESGVWYYHNRLRIMPPPMVSYLDHASGEIVYVNPQEFYVKMITSFTVDDLLEYWYRKFGGMRHSAETKQFAGALRHLAERYGIDVLLFTIDYVYELIHVKNVEPPRTPFDIHDYVGEGTKTLYRKQTMERREGIS